MGPLTELYLRQVQSGRCSDKGTVHSYIEVYEQLLAPYRTTAKRVLEIGIFNGDSMRLWEDYFAPGVEVYGVDLEECPHGGLGDLRPILAEGGHKIVLLDATEKDEVEEHFAGLQFDVIIDDASHAVSEQIEIWENLKDHLAPNGLYVIEDIENIQRDAEKLRALHPSARILDRRTVKLRFDDVLIVIGGR